MAILAEYYPDIKIHSSQFCKFYKSSFCVAAIHSPSYKYIVWTTA